MSVSSSPRSLPPRLAAAVCGPPAPTSGGQPCPAAAASPFSHVASPEICFSNRARPPPQLQFLRQIGCLKMFRDCVCSQRIYSVLCYLFLFFLRSLRLSGRSFRNRRGSSFLFAIEKNVLNRLMNVLYK